MKKLRYVVSPYTYYGDSSRPQSWGVWDTTENRWAWSAGGKQEAQEEADLLNCKFYECPECGFVEADSSIIDEITCYRCDRTYFPA